MTSIDFCKKAYPWITLTLLVVTVFVVKFNVLGKYPPSDDMGGHLANLKTYFYGLDIRPERWFHHPPLYYILVLEPLTILFPTFLALNIAAAFVSTIIAIPMFFLVREITGSDKAAIISSFLFTFSELYSEIMCWGELLNLFGIFFMLFSICYFIKVVEDNSWKNVVLAGVFFSLTIGAHHLTAVYYAVVLVICVPLFLMLKAARLRPLLRTFLLLIVITILLSLPYLHVYISLFHQRVNVATGFLPSIEIVYLSFWNSFATVTREWPAILSLVAIVVASAVNLWRRHRTETLTGIVLSLAVTVFALALMFHPSLMSRPFYFIHIPIFLAFGVLLSDAFTGLCRRNLLQKVIFYALLTTAVLSLTTAAYTRMIVAKNFYQSLNDETVEALDWLKQYTNNDAVILTNYAMLPGWIEGYSERKTISPRELDILIYSLEYQESIIANEILSGNHIVMNPYLLVSDDFPTSSRNPQISAKAGEWYTELIFFQDSWQTLQENNPKSSSVVKTVENINQTNSSVSVTYKYSSDWAVLTRRIEILCNSQISIFYDLKLTNSSIEDFQIPVCVFPANRVDSFVVNDEGIVFSLTTPYYGQVNEVEVSLVETNCESLNVTFETYPLKKQPTFVFSLHNEDSELYAHFQISIDLEIKSTGNVEYSSAQELLGFNNVTHLLLDKSDALDLYRFVSETDKYEVVYENSAVLIVKLKK